MSFELAIVLIVALAAILVGLVVYNLLGRLHVLESAVQGGLAAPSRRLSREEFERQFSIATARARLAKRFDTGVVVFVDATSGTGSEVVEVLGHLPRHDLVHVIACDKRASDELRKRSVPHVPLDELDLALSSLGVSTLPFGLIVDESAVRASRHLASPDALVELLAEFT